MIDGLVDSLSVFSTSGTSAYTLNFFYERSGLPIIVAADSTAPSPISTSYGTIATSILSPGPGSFLLDGLGIFGPPNLSIVTTPRPNNVEAQWSTSLNFPTAALADQTIVMQVYAIDLARSPQSVAVVSNAVTRMF